MTKTQNYKIRIEENRQQITNMLSGADTHKRLNNINWLRHELSYTEPRTLFYVPSREQFALSGLQQHEKSGDGI